MSRFIDASKLSGISIVGFLAKLGHHPVHKSGKEHFYHSMVRETGKNTPSFTVWDAGGKWKDWGGVGASPISSGGIVQLCMALWPGTPFVDVLERICEIDGYAIVEPVFLDTARSSSNTKKEEGYSFELIRTAPIGTHPVLENYLRQRCLDGLPEGFLNEVYFSNRNEDESGKQYFAIGWPNVNGGWEFSGARGFKGSIDAKGISIIAGSPDHTVLFEGYFDFLSWLKIQTEKTRPTVIVLNSVALVGMAIAEIQDVAKVDVYFDHDIAGKNATKLVLAEVPQAIDSSSCYSGHKDFNEKLIADSRATCRGDPLEQGQHIKRGR